MTEDIKFSVTVPAYKAQFLGECIDSILAQTYKNFEVIIVNDASPQDLDSIVNKYDDPRIRYYKNKVGFGAEHVVGNWNKCLEYATGDYVICMGDDDKLMPNCLEEYVKLMKQHPDLNVYHALTEIIDENSDFYSMQEARPEREGMYSMMYGRLCNSRKQFIGDWLFRTDWLKSIGGFVDIPMAWGSDDLTAYKAAQTKGVANSQTPMFQYRVNSHTLSNTGNTLVKFKAMRQTFAEIKQLLDNPRTDIDALDEKYRQSVLKIIDEKIRASQSVIMRQDMTSRGLIKSILWWRRNASKYQISSSEILKAAIKAMNN